MTETVLHVLRQALLDKSFDTTFFTRSFELIWRIYESFSSIFLTTNQRTILLIIAYRPSKQSLLHRSTHLQRRASRRLRLHLMPFYRYRPPRAPCIAPHPGVVPHTPGWAGAGASTPPPATARPEVTLWLPSSQASQKRAPAGRRRLEAASRALRALIRSLPHPLYA